MGKTAGWHERMGDIQETVLASTPMIHMCLFDAKVRGDSKPFHFKLRRKDGAAVGAMCRQLRCITRRAYYGYVQRCNLTHYRTIAAETNHLPRRSRFRRQALLQDAEESNFHRDWES